MSADKKIESAGVIVVRHDKARNEHKLLLMKAYDFWDFPKGGIEKGESKLEAAVREVEEESGINDLDFCWGKTFYETESFGKFNKRVFYFVAKTEKREVVISKNPQTGFYEHEDYMWLSFKDAKKITVQRIKKAIEWAEERVLNLYESNN